MKLSHLIPVFFVAGLLASCASSKFSKDGSKEKKFVTQFCSYMDQESGPKYKEMMDCISPTYIRENNISTSSYKVNNYSIYGSSIESFIAKTGAMKVKVWGEKRAWVHLLEFKLVKEKGKLYLYPGNHSDSYIDPWFKVDSYIRE
jgi:hypothetical protein